MALDVELYHGDCLDYLPLLQSESVDAVITDPIYPCIKRDYGYITVEEWWALIVEGVVPEVRRVLKPTGSAVFILQPNSEHVGQMRGWLWEFMAWVCREWNMVQDVWWWNIVTMPTVHASQYDLMRGAIKPCVWCGSASCYRNQVSVLWTESAEMTAQRLARRADSKTGPSGYVFDRTAMLKASSMRGGVTPFNVLPIANTSKRSGHGAGTPLKLADWWVRYICPPGGTVLDPFVGSGTMGIAAVQNGCNFIGIDKEARYIDIAVKRIREAKEKYENDAQQLDLPGLQP